MVDVFLDGSFLPGPANPTGDSVGLLELFTYLWLKLICQTYYPSFPRKPEECTAYARLFLQDTPSRLVSVLYAMTQTDSPLTVLRAIIRWEESLGYTTEDVGWQYCLR